jgi:hypothetical protein
MNDIHSQLTKHNSEDISETEKQSMFEMYQLSYNMGGQPLWFKNPNELFSRYPCFVTFNNEFLKVYAMYQFKPKYNKISLVCHDGSEEGKQLSIKLRLQLLNTNGWMLEAADKVSWILRKNRAPIITGYDNIIDALDIAHNENDKIQLNDAFNYEDKTSYYYIRFYNDIRNAKIYESKETLFGTAPCHYTNTDCKRECNIVSGGTTKRKTYKRKRIKRKSKHR